MGTQIRLKRTAAGISGALFCARLGWDRNKLYNVERGYARVSDEEIARVHCALDELIRAKSAMRGCRPRGMAGGVYLMPADLMSDRLQKTQAESRMKVPVRGFDVAAVRQYFAGLESMAREARDSRDPRVLATALKVVARQHLTVSELVRGRES